ncbi:MAG TPA: glycosyltransferase family 9 protein [Sediminibacterium sp.]|nr:glycosyltransferase family 9 protein [Sediminibacterium sp.]
MRSALIIQTAFIGDAVLATGLLEKMHLAFPEAKLDILVRKGNEGLFRQHPFLQEVLVWQKQTKKYLHWWKLLRRIRQKKYDLVINVQRFAATGLLTALSGAGKTIGFDKNPFSFLFTHIIPHRIEPGVHEYIRNHDLIRTITDDIPAKPRLYPAPADLAAVETYRQTAYCCMAPASVWFTKQYPAQKWVELIRALPPAYTVYLIGAPGDRALCEEIRLASGRENLYNLSGKLSFLAAAALQAGAVMNYVNDSAPLHFASAVNAPVTAVYCSTLPSFGFGPLSDESHIVELDEILSCRPCGLHGQRSCPQRHFHCAFHIRVAQLLQVLPVPPAAI